jgi:hypothetical protein
VSAVLLLLPTILALLAEAAWVTVLASLLQAFTLRPPTVGFPWFLAAAVLGLLAARVLPPRFGDRWPVAAAGLAIGCAALAWLSAAEVRAILAAQGADALGEAIAANLGAWLVAVAFVRGIAHARLPEDPTRIANLLGLAIPGLAIVAVIGGMVSEPYRGAFLAEAQAEVLLFLVAGVLALSLSRLGLIATGAAVDWRRNPAWVGLLVVLLLATAGVAIAASAYAGPVIVVALGALFAPLLIIGFFVGFERRSVAILALSVIGTAAVATVLQLFASNNAALPPLSPGGAIPPEPDVAAATPVTIGVLGIVLAVAVIALLVLARLWLRRPRDEESLVPETREIDRGDWEQERAGHRRRGLFRRRAGVHDAVAAYRTLLADLEPHPGLRRLPGETPAEHAARLRRTGSGGLALDLLAADYGLARFGGVTLSLREERRALARAASLRRRLLRR